MNAVAVQLPIGLEDHIKGLVDVVSRKAYHFEGSKGEIVKEIPVPEDLVSSMESTRTELIERLAEVDEAIGDKFLEGEEISTDELKAALRRATIALSIVPVFMGTAYKNKGVQLLLNGVTDYLPNPTEKKAFAMDRDNDEAEVELTTDAKAPLVALAFKLEESRYVLQYICIVYICVSFPYDVKKEARCQSPPMGKGR